MSDHEDSKADAVARAQRIFQDYQHLTDADKALIAKHVAHEAKSTFEEAEKALETSAEAICQIFQNYWEKELNKIAPPETLWDALMDD